MPNTRHMHFSPDFRRPLPDASELLEVNYPAFIDTSSWIPNVTQEQDSTTFGIEVFMHRRMPDGTPLTTEERQYIAAVAIKNLKEGEQ